MAYGRTHRSLPYSMCGADRDATWSGHEELAFCPAGYAKRHGEPQALLDHFIGDSADPAGDSLRSGVRHAEAQAAAEPGLAATYYNNKNLTAPTLTRTDPQINFSWGKGSPSRRIDPDTFSARWTGQVQAPSSGSYTFYTYTSDGVRLWVDGELIVGAWSTPSAREWRDLSAGRRALPDKDGILRG